MNSVLTKRIYKVHFIFEPICVFVKEAAALTLYLSVIISPLLLNRTDSPSVLPDLLSRFWYNTHAIILHRNRKEKKHGFE